MRTRILVWKGGEVLAPPPSRGRCRRQRRRRGYAELDYREDAYPHRALRAHLPLQGGGATTSLAL
jgi:hypothetical protein